MNIVIKTEKVNAIIILSSATNILGLKFSHGFCHLKTKALKVLNLNVQKIYLLDN